MRRYIGLIFIFTQIFLHYVSISGPTAVIALCVGLFATIAGVVMVFVRRYRKYITVLAIISFLPIFIGIGGSLLWTRQLKETTVRERKVGLEPSANKYFDLEYGYNESSISWFPAIIGTMSAIPAILLVSFLRHRSKAQKK